MKEKKSVINFFDNPYPTYCKLFVEEFECYSTSSLRTRPATVADIYAAAKVNNCIVVTAEEYKSFVEYRDAYLASKEVNSDQTD